jgi:hypothetical protein
MRSAKLKSPLLEQEILTWDALNYVTEQFNYEVTDDWFSIVSIYPVPQILQEQYKFSLTGRDGFFSDDMQRSLRYVPVYLFRFYFLGVNTVSVDYIFVFVGIVTHHWKSIL